MYSAYWPSVMAAEYGVIVSSLCLLLVMDLSQGRVYHKSVWYLPVGQDADFDPLMSRGFGFLAGGEVHFVMTCPVLDPEYQPEFWLLFCSTAEAREFSRMTYSQMSFDCHGLSETLDHANKPSTYCLRSRVLPNDTHNEQQYSYRHEMTHSHYYTIILLQCRHSQDGHNQTNASRFFISSRQCRSTLVALNPGGTHLSSDEAPLPLIYTIINLVWATLVAAWFFNWVIYFRFSNRLHRLISCAPIFKVILVVLVLLWWQEIANTGQEPTDISSVRHFVQSVEDALLFMMMMVIAEGWGVIRCHIKHYRWTSLLLLFVVFATSLMCVHWVHRYFLAFSVCCVIFMMYKTLKWSSHNIELLRRRRRKIRRFITRHSLHYQGYVTIDMQIMAKYNVYHKFRIICAIFSMVYAIAVTLATFLHEYSYIQALTFELPELVVYISIGIIFRLRNFEAYENIELVPPKENIVVLELPMVCIGEVDPHVTLGIPQHFKVEKETQTPIRRRWHSSIR